MLGIIRKGTENKMIIIVIIWYGHVWKLRTVVATLSLEQYCIAGKHVSKGQLELLGDWNT